ncbi:hypothetical protein CWE21_00685 [Pseudidiomarina aquimaris]|uniref:Phosphoenolpyruvate carboxylase n=1 Tax=Pseudidiomarina aquimaris TaxID=641841 RepID=A0A432XPR4_9GAMM|nr:hypothetical protein [Pseudidiomarina aquimaris]RUO50653.1 hypothetical protein CWE21_00685 [Pseudidiomarina aquimaris]
MAEPISGMLSLGAERLALIGKHAQTLMKGYLQGEIDPDAFSESTRRKLIDARVLYHPEDSFGLKLRQPVTQLIAALVTDEARRQIHADVAEKLETIRVRVESYREARRRGDYVKADLQLQVIHETVYDLTGQFEEAIHSLWHRLNSNFGFVSSLSDKIRENSRAQEQIKRLLDGISLLNFNEMIELAEGNPVLRKVLVTRLQNHLDRHLASLLEVQKRLVELMGRFREQQARGLLVSQMASFLRQHPSFVVGDYAYRSQVPKLVNCAAPTSVTAAVALDRRADSPEIVGLVHQLYKELALKTAKSTASANDDVLTTTASAPEVEARQQQLKADAEQYFLAVLENKAGDSAIDYLVTQELEWSPEVWLFQILAEFAGLPQQQQRMFVLERSEYEEQWFNQVRVIDDVTLRLGRL